MRMAADDLRETLERLFREHGASEEEATSTASVLVEAELRGRRSHGLNRVGGIVKGLDRGRGGEPRMVEERGAFALMDGNDASGYVAAFRMVDIAARISERAGHALVAVRNTRHAGFMGYYADRLADMGAVSLMVTHCCPLMAPHGGIDPVLGTNPITAGFPWKPRNILVDLGTSATTQGAISVAQREGRAAMPDAAVDKNGDYTTQASAVHALLPFGGAKGYALGLMVQLLAGPLIGAAAIPEMGRDYGILLFALRPEAFGDRASYETHVSEVVRQVKSARRAPGVEEILLPGERAFREREARLRDGIEIDEAAWSEIVAR